MQVICLILKQTAWLCFLKVFMLMIVDLGEQFLFVAWFNTVLRIHIILIRIRILSTDLLPYLLLIKGIVDVN